MPSYIQNYGFTKTLLQDNNNNRLHNEIKWQGNYDGKMANIDLDVNDNGDRKFVNIQLDNNDIKHIFGVQPVEEPLEKRLVKDFLYTNKPMTLTLIKQKSRRRRKSRRKSRKNAKSRKKYIKNKLKII